LTLVSSYDIITIKINISPNLIGVFLSNIDWGDVPPPPSYDFAQLFKACSVKNKLEIFDG